MPAPARVAADPFLTPERRRRFDAVRWRGTASPFPSLRVLLEADLRGWLPVMGVPLPEDTIQAILLEAEHAMRAYVGPDGTVAFGQSAHIVSGAA